MRLVSRRLLSSQGGVRELCYTCFPFPRSHALSTAGTIIVSRSVGAVLSTAKTFSAVPAASRFASFSSQGMSVRAFSSFPSSTDEHNKDRTTKATSQVNKNFLRTISRNGRPFLPHDFSNLKGWYLRGLLPLNLTRAKSGMPALGGNSSVFLKKLQQGHVDASREFPITVRYLNTAFLLPVMIVYNKISSVFLLNLSLLWHINHGMGEIMADYVHQQMTRNLMLVLLKLFLLIAMKDVFLSLVF